MADVIVVPSIFYIWHAWCMEGRVGGFSRSPKNIVAQIQPCYKHCKPECDKFKSYSMFFFRHPLHKPSRPWVESTSVKLDRQEESPVREGQPDHSL